MERAGRRWHVKCAAAEREWLLHKLLTAPAAARARKGCDVTQSGHFLSGHRDRPVAQATQSSVPAIPQCPVLKKQARHNLRQFSSHPWPARTPPHSPACTALPLLQRRRCVPACCVPCTRAAMACRRPLSASVALRPCFPPPCGRRKAHTASFLRTASTACTCSNACNRRMRAATAPPRPQAAPRAHGSHGTDEVEQWTWN